MLNIREYLNFVRIANGTRMYEVMDAYLWKLYKMECGIFEGWLIGHDIDMNDMTAINEWIKTHEEEEA